MILLFGVSPGENNQSNGNISWGEKLTTEAKQFPFDAMECQEFTSVSCYPGRAECQ